MRHSELLLVQISSSGSLEFWRYILWKLGFVTILEIILKRAIFLFSL
jgi:hypothetical protein